MQGEYVRRWISKFFKPYTCPNASWKFQRENGPVEAVIAQPRHPTIATGSCEQRRKRPVAGPGLPRHLRETKIFPTSVFAFPFRLYR
jgi:hypothetical protein